MRRFNLILIFGLVLIGGAMSSQAASAKVLKVLPHFLDHKGRIALYPSLYERDAYQDFLRKNPAQISTLRFDVHWKAKLRSKPVTLRVEMRGSKTGALAEPLIVEQTAKAGWVRSRWTSVPLTAGQFEKIGELVAWRATLWDGETMLAEQKSFLW